MSKEQFAALAVANAALAATMPLPAAAGLTVGQIASANEDRMTAATFNQALTEYAVGWQPQEDLLGAMEYIAPSVEVGRRFEFKRAKNGEAFLSETDDVRAIGATFKRVEYSGETVNEKTINKGLTLRLDRDEMLGNDAQERAVDRLLRRMWRNELRRVVAALDAAAANENSDWQIGNPNADPDGAVTDMLLAAADKVGIPLNRLLYGATAWQYRSKYYRTIDTKLGAALYGMTPQALAATFGVESARVLEARYQTAVAAAAKTKVIGAKVYGFFAEDGVGKDDPSNLKRFVSPTQQGGRYAVYVEEYPKYVDVTVEHYSNVVVTSTLGVSKLTVSQSPAAAG